jgi:hypothetical protein
MRSSPRLLAEAHNLDALALAPTVGWLLLAAAVVAAALAGVHREALARWWLSAEDPRPLALFRIVFALLLIGEIVGLCDHWRFFFTDEGLFSADDAQEIYAAAQFAGYGDGHDGDPRGFFDLAGFVQHLRGAKFSLLYFWDSPLAFGVHLAALLLAVLALLFGAFTRLAALLGFVLFNSLLYRNEIFWEGTEMVYRCYFAYLVVGRAGHAWSVDNWRRCRRLAARGQLSLPSGPGAGAGLAPCPAHPRGLSAIYRRIPVWPRRLMMLQLAAIYCFTGVVKNGAIWRAGDALYYALNLDHFYRFYPQALAAAYGLDLFRLMTWVTKWWEALFPLLLVGHAIAWRRAQALAPLTAARRRLAALLWPLLGLLALTLVLYTLPVHLDPALTEREVLDHQRLTALAGLAAIALLFALVRRLARAPIALERIRLLFLSRRLWLGLGLIFQGSLILLMSIGMFQWVMLAAALAYLSGDDLQKIAERLARRRRAQDRPRFTYPPAESPHLLAHAGDPRRIPDPVLSAIILIAAAGAVIQAEGGPRWWFAGGLALLLLLLAAARSARAAVAPPIPTTHAPVPWAYGPLGRAMIGALCLWHVVAVALWMLPAKSSTASFRYHARGVAQPWLKITQTSQSWEMFAPNPPTKNMLLRVLVYDARGDAYDMNTDVYAGRPIPQIWYDRMRKVNRRVLASEGVRYQPWIARYYCRKWALDHHGEAPERVELRQLSYPIPPPEQLHASGPYHPPDRLRSHGQERVVERQRCADTIAGQLSNAVRARHGLPSLPPDIERPWAKHRYAAWRARHKAP